MPKGVYKRAPEQIAVMTERLLSGRIKRWTPEARIKASEMTRGCKNPFFGKTHNVVTREKISIAKKGQKMPWRVELGRMKFTLDNPAKKDSVRAILRQRKLGKNNPHWNGGVTSLNGVIRNSPEYKEWRRKVFNRDSYTCVWCKRRESGNLNADHIKPFALYPELRFDLNNVRTLCIDCHKKTDTYGNKSKKIMHIVDFVKLGV